MFINEKYELAGQVYLQRASKEPTNAKKWLELGEAEYKKLSTMSQTFGLATKQFDIRGKFLIAQLQEGLGKGAESQALFQEIWDSGKDNKENVEAYRTALSAYSRLGVKALKDKNYVGAKAIFDNITKDDLAAGDQMLGVAYRGLGDCLLQEKKFAEARSAYLRVVLVYKGAGTSEVIAAATGAIKCFQRIQDTDWEVRVNFLKKAIKDRGGKYED
jgi:tetratricopeptide (TPR) repeat protein